MYGAVRRALARPAGAGELSEIAFCINASLEAGSDRGKPITTAEAYLKRSRRENQAASKPV
jgi:hypothetical protein